MKGGILYCGDGCCGWIVREKVLGLEDQVLGRGWFEVG